MRYPTDSSKFSYGLEYEFALLRNNADKAVFVDFSNTTYEQLSPIIDQLPVYKEDYPSLRVGDLGIKSKRWYIEGFERFSQTGDYLRMDIKGPEIRTPISNSIDQAMDYLETDFEVFAKVSQSFGYRPIAVGLNPFQSKFVPEPPLNKWELTSRHTPEEQTAYIHMLTYGPDVSISHPDFSDADIIDIAQKLTHYSPFIAPFSYASPFYEGKLWPGLSRRTYYRTGLRPAALVFLHHQDNLIKSVPTLTESARVPAEAGRIEYKAFDCCPDRQLYGSLLALIKGLTLDTTLTKRASIPDTKLHQHSAIYGFTDDTIYQESLSLVQAAKSALPEEDRHWLVRLEDQLATRQCPANKMIERYKQNNDIIKTLEEVYDTTV